MGVKRVIYDLRLELAIHILINHNIDWHLFSWRYWLLMFCETRRYCVSPPCQSARMKNLYDALMLIGIRAAGRLVSSRGLPSQRQRTQSIESTRLWARPSTSCRPRATPRQQRAVSKETKPERESISKIYLYKRPCPNNFISIDSVMETEMNSREVSSQRDKRKKSI